MVSGRSEGRGWIPWNRRVLIGSKGTLSFLGVDRPRGDIGRARPTVGRWDGVPIGTSSSVLIKVRILVAHPLWRCVILLRHICISRIGIRWSLTPWISHW